MAQSTAAHTTAGRHEEAAGSLAEAGPVGTAADGQQHPWAREPWTEAWTNAALPGQARGDRTARLLHLPANDDLEDRAPRAAWLAPMLLAGIGFWVMLGSWLLG